MYRNAATLRICAALTSLSSCAVMLACLLGIIPDRASEIAKGRVEFVESVAVSATMAAQTRDYHQVLTLLKSITERNEEVESAGLRLPDGTLVADIGEHRDNWKPDKAGSAARWMQVPLYVNGQTFGTIELQFKPLDHLLFRFLPVSILAAVSFIGGLTFLGNFWYLRRVLQHLDPSKVIPNRVRTTLDTLAEGLLILDHEERIVMANLSFSDTICRLADELLGQRADTLPWLFEPDQPVVFPWTTSIRDGKVKTDARLTIQNATGTKKVFKVNCSPIFSDSAANRGVLVIFTDVTELEIRNAQLRNTLTRLHHSREQIQKHNETLKALAARDPLTRCHNRRYFFETVEREIRIADPESDQLAYAILDIDHFKSINDNHGHARGDEVLRQVAKLLRTEFEPAATVCRYGGEEFSLLLPNQSIESANRLTNAFRAKLASTPIADLKVTASIGLAMFDLKKPDSREVLEQADQALYVAKRSGRNRVASWDQVQNADMAAEAPQLRRSEESKTHVPFTAVAALSSALHYRDPATAEHSRRVAHQAAIAARGLVSEEQRYLLEVAALLHDIGKLGVPDAILQKPGELTSDEWRLMRTHERIGLTIVENAFTCSELMDILRSYRAPLEDNGIRKEIPVTARLLRIADAYDSMITRSTFRDARSREEAFRELRECTSQFDPELVERFIAAVHENDASRRVNVRNLNRRAALELGFETEKLAYALDSRDRVTVKSMSARLTSLAREHGLQEIGALCRKIEAAAEEDSEWIDLLQSAAELLDICRNAQLDSVVADADSQLKAIGLYPDEGRGIFT